MEGEKKKNMFRKFDLLENFDANSSQKCTMR